MATATRVDLADQVQGTLSASNGGTGATSLAGASIEQTTNKNAANGYAGLNSSTLLTSGLLGSGTSSSSTVLTGGTTGAWTSLTRAIVPETVTTSSAGTLGLTTSSSAYVFTGTTATWTLPAVSGNTGRFLILESRGSGAVTLNPAGSDFIWLFGGTVTTYTIAAGGSLQLVNDGTYWNALSTDLAHNSAGILPAANGGTGQSSLTSLTLTTPTITGYTETLYNIGTVTTSYAINLANGTVQTCTLTNGDTCIFSVPTPTAGQSFVILVKQPATTGTGLATFPSGTVKWPAPSTPVMTGGAGKADLYTFFSDGTDWYANAAQGYTY